MAMVYYRDYFLFQTVKLETRGVAALFGFGGVLDENSSHTRNAGQVSQLQIYQTKREKDRVQNGRNLFQNIFTAYRLKFNDPAFLCNIVR